LTYSARFSGLRERVAGIQPLHPPHSKRNDWRSYSTGHLAADLPITSQTPMGAIRTKEKNHGIKKGKHEAQEGQEIRSHQTAGNLDY
jgi:hypothetical protein